MTSPIVSPAKFFMGSLALCASSLAAAATDLSVKINGVRSSQGMVLVALYDKAETFPQTGAQLQARALPASQAGEAVVFRGLPAGRYAVAVIHDENGNGKLDRNLLGIPSEAYGFSNDAMGFASPPSFEKAAVILSADAAITINLR